MARIRTIKPEFWTHEGLCSLPEAVHLLAAALLNYADDEGYFNANPALVKAACTPLREPSVSIHESLKQLSDIGYLRLGTGPDGRQYGHIASFESHQRVNRPSPSRIKDLRINWGDSLIPHAQFTEPSPLEGKGKEGNGKDCGEAGKQPSPPPSAPKTDCPETAKIERHVFPTFGCVIGERTKQVYWLLTSEQIAEWREVFPGVSVESECRQAHAWVKANWQRRKTYDGMLDFLRRWLSKEQNKTSVGSGSKPPAKTSTPVPMNAPEPRKDIGKWAV